ncbi:Transmembrane protein [Trema orientale]|uniref:Transmembrane protein n=1 Tax=Trema orientale TaxID=63057 RepID=A0A2P5CPH8_TREOI|nr:Transmembrane protein [Trema orientale]
MYAFHIATQNGDIKIMEKLSTVCPDVFELLTSNGQTALHVAVRSRKKDVIEFLLKTLPSDLSLLINKQDKDGNTALHLACNLEDHEIICMLLHDERVNGFALNKDGLTASDIIQSCKNLEESQKVSNFYELSRNRYTNKARKKHSKIVLIARKELTY